MDQTNFTIIDSRLEDLDRISVCHRNAFPKSLSSRLGKHFIKNMLSWYITSDRGVMYHYEENGIIIGYVGGIITLLPGLPGASTSITQHSFGVFFWSFVFRPWLIFHSENLNRLPFVWRNIRIKSGLYKINKYAVINTIENFLPHMGLVVIGVDPEYQGRGVGSLLLKEFELRAIKNGLKLIQLSVKHNNLQAISTYKKNGWMIDRTVKEDLVMIKFL